MTSKVMDFLYFFIFVFLSYILPILIFGYGSYVFFSEGEYFVSIAFLITSVAFMVMLISRRTSLSQKRIEWLISNGQKVITEFKKLDRRWNTSINGESPFVIYTQDANGRIFESEDIWANNPNETIYINDASTRALETLQSRDPNIKYIISVYVDTRKHKDYYMDLGSLYTL